jgi:hypothetical protein
MQGDRYASAQGGKIWKTDNGRFGNAQQMIEHVSRAVCCLQRLTQDSHIKTGIREVRQIRICIPLYDRQSFGDRCRHTFWADLHAAPITFSMPHEIIQQVAIPAADVKHTRANGHMASDNREIRAQKYRHAACS